MTGRGMVVMSLHRYPVKSMLGESPTSLALDDRGVVGDRLWSVRTAAGKIGSGKDTRRFAAVRGLLDLRAAELDGAVVIEFPDGSRGLVQHPETAAAVSRHVGEPVTLAPETDVVHFDDGPVSIIGRASVDAVTEARGETVDARRFRANVVLDTATAFVEEAWVGRDVRIGAVVLHVTMTSPRCVVVNAPTAELPAQPGNLAAISRLNGMQLGVIATVVVPGVVHIGDRVEPS